MDKENPKQARMKILIVDDVPANLRVLSALLESEGYQIFSAPNGEVAEKVAVQAKPDLILLDVVMPGKDGFETCRQLKKNAVTADIPVIFITVKDKTEELVKGFRAGGIDYIAKPFQAEEVLARVQTHLKINQLIRDLQQEIAQRKAIAVERNHLSNRLDIIRRHEAEHWGIDGIVGESRTVQQILAKISRLQNAETTTVLITGESGTGKELVARAIHSGSTKAKGPFIPVNCAAIPRDLAESLCFGHVKGAFTGALEDQEGYVSLADGGTLFLDEIGDMPLELQAKFLRVFEDRYVIPIGATHGRQVDVRILTATNADLTAKMNQGGFRQDLYYRLARIRVDIPPLRERREDVPILANHFLHMFAAEMGIETPRLSLEALEALQAYHFPGNVRELKHLLEGALIECDDSEIFPKHIHFVEHLEIPNANGASVEIPLNLKQGEVFLIKRALKKAEGNVSEAARLLGVTRATIYRKLAQQDFS